MSIHRKSDRRSGTGTRLRRVVMVASLVGLLRLWPLSAQTPKPAGNSAGFDRNLYPGDDRLAELRRHFAFAGFWLNHPPGEKTNSWAGHRPQLLRAGFGFLVLFNGRLITEIDAAGMAPEALARKDAADAVAAAKREGFPPRTIIFLDVEEGGRLEPQQAAYLFGWTQALAASSYLPGEYVSGQPAPDGPGKTITTAQDVQSRIASQHLHPVVLWVAQDACPPAPGCVAAAPPLSASGTPDAAVWQYAQSPRRRTLTQSCAQTYAADGMCYAPGNKDLFLDMNVAASPDPSHGR